MKAYHFTGETLRDGRPIPPIGEWLEHNGELVPCIRGLHASVHPFDALEYAPGNLLHLVVVEDYVEHGNPPDKVCARRRKILATIDAEKLLREFACWCALKVAHLWDCPDVVRLYLETGKDSLRAAAWAAARDAARAAARDAARDAARAAARAAAWDAAWDASRDVARAAAWDAARAVAWAASRDVARAAAWAAAWDASRDVARAAAWDAAWDAAWAEQRNKFAEMVNDEFGIK